MAYTANQPWGVSTSLPGAVDTGYKGPNVTGTTPFNPDFYTQAAANALPSAASRDTAAARIRSRMEGAQKSQSQQISSQYGTRPQGLQERAQRLNRQKSMGDYGSSLADLELGFADKQQHGAEILSGIGHNYNQDALGMNDFLLNDYKTKMDADLTQRQQDITGKGIMGNLEVQRHGQDLHDFLDPLQAYGTFGNMFVPLDAQGVGQGNAGKLNTIGNSIRRAILSSMGLSPDEIAGMMPQF